MKSVSGLGNDIVLYVEWVSGYRIIGTRWVGDDGLYFTEIFPPEAQQFMNELYNGGQTAFDQELRDMSTELEQEAAAFYSQ